MLPFSSSNIILTFRADFRNDSQDLVVLRFKRPVMDGVALLKEQVHGLGILLDSSLSLGVPMNSVALSIWGQLRLVTS